MKNLKSTIVLIAFALLTSIGYSQVSTTTVYFDYFSNPQVVGANDVGEDIVNDGNDNLFVAGEQAKDGALQDVRIIKYGPNGNVLSQNAYINATYREYVKKIVYDPSNGRVLVFCNAVNISSGAQSMLILSYGSSSLNFISATFYTAANYFNPVNAVTAGLGTAIFVTCYKKNGNSSSLAVLRLNSSLAVVNTFIYSYSSLTDNIQENPTDLIYSSSESAVYVCGGVVDTINRKSAAIIMKLTAGLAQTWNIVNPLDFGKNVYNSIALNTTHLFAAGSMRNNPNNKHSWVIRRLDKTNGSTLNSRAFNPGTTFYSEAMKITLANSANVLVAGYAKDTATSVYNVQIGKYLVDLGGTASYCGSSMGLNSTLKDAVSYSSGYTYVTGSRANGSNKNMFLLGFNALSGGANTFRDSIVNKNSCGNKIVLMTKGLNIAAVTGFQDKSSNMVTPADLKMTTRFYYTQILRDGNALENEKEVIEKMYPNPANETVNISNSAGIQKYMVFDLQGRIIMNETVSELLNDLQLNISNLPKGLYFVQINDGKAQKLVKN